jgi:hypothetical protein
LFEGAGAWHNLRLRSFLSVDGKPMIPLGSFAAPPIKRSCQFSHSKLM